MTSKFRVMKKVLYLIVGIVLIGSVSCGDDEIMEEVEYVDLEGYFIQEPFFTEPAITCGDIPYPSGFEDVEGIVSPLGDISGGRIEFQNCRLADYNNQSVFSADYTGFFNSTEGDIVNYQGTLYFLPGSDFESVSKGTIFGGTGRWANAEGEFDFVEVEPYGVNMVKGKIDGRITKPVN
jgi:hypothetical protein